MAGTSDEEGQAVEMESRSAIIRGRLSPAPGVLAQDPVGEETGGMVDRISKTLWRGHRRRLERQIAEYAGILLMIEGRLVRMRGRAKRTAGAAQARLESAIKLVESDYRKVAEGWQAILKGLDHTITSAREVAREAITQADTVLAEGSRLLTGPASALRRARVEAAALRKGLEVGFRRGRRLAAVASGRRAARANSLSRDPMRDGNV